MGVTKQMQLEEMDRISREECDKDDAFIDTDESSRDPEDQWEDDMIEQSIEDDAIEADMKRQDDIIRKAKNNG